MFGRSRSEDPPVTQATHDTVLGPGCKIDGDVTVRGSVLVQGEVEGAVHATGEVEIERGAHVQGEIRGEHARVSGRIDGNVKVRDSIELRQGAHLSGDVYARSFRIQDGAVFQGNCHMGRESESPSLSDRVKAGDR